MTNAIALVENRPNLASGGRVAAIVPQTMDEAYRLAKAICMSGMAPKGLDTPEKAMVAIMHGLEIGLTPMRALQTIAVVNGRPTLFGDGVVGLVRGSGLCEWVRETIEGVGDNRVAVCETKRKGEPQSVKRTFSVNDAKKAGLWGKGGPWTQYPERMLSVRARSFAMRDGFADVLGGMYLKEEIEDIPVAAKRPPAPDAYLPPQAHVEAKLPEPPAPAKRPPAPAPAPVDAVFGDTMPIDPEAIVADYENYAASAQTEANLDEIWAHYIAADFDKLGTAFQARIIEIRDRNLLLIHAAG